MPNMLCEAISLLKAADVASVKPGCWRAKARPNGRKSSLKDRPAPEGNGAGNRREGDGLQPVRRRRVTIG